MLPANDQTYWGRVGHALALQTNPIAGRAPGDRPGACDDFAPSYGGGPRLEAGSAAALSFTFSHEVTNDHSD